MPIALVAAGRMMAGTARGAKTIFEAQKAKGTLETSRHGLSGRNSFDALRSETGKKGPLSDFQQSPLDLTKQEFKKGSRLADNFKSTNAQEGIRSLKKSNSFHDFSLSRRVTEQYRVRQLSQRSESDSQPAQQSRQRRSESDSSMPERESDLQPTRQLRRTRSESDLPRAGEDSALERSQQLRRTKSESDLSQAFKRAETEGNDYYSKAMEKLKADAATKRKAGDVIREVADDNDNNSNKKANRIGSRIADTFKEAIFNPYTTKPWAVGLRGASQSVGSLAGRFDAATQSMMGSGGGGSNGGGGEGLANSLGSAYMYNKMMRNQLEESELSTSSRGAQDGADTRRDGSSGRARGSRRRGEEE